MKLYYAPGACSLAPHIILREAGLTFELDKTDLRAKRTESGADFAAINPKGQVPTLGLDSGEILTENAVINQYIADQAPESGLLPPAGTMERYRALEWLTFITTELHKSFSPLFKPNTPDDYKPIVKENLAARFAHVDRHLADGRTYLTGDTFTAPDAYLFVMLAWADRMALDLSKLANLKAYHERVAARPKVQEALRAEGLA